MGDTGICREKNSCIQCRFGKIKRELLEALQGFRTKAAEKLSTGLLQFSANCALPRAAVIVWLIWLLIGDLWEHIA